MERSPAQGMGSADSDWPNGARIYDYLLGGGYNFAVDRAAVDRLLAIVPDAERIVRSNREFLSRAVRYAMRRGIDQFLDLGSGMPTRGNVHTVAQGLDPRARVVYVDSDEIAAESGRRLLADNDRADFVHADFRDPERVLGTEQARRLLDLSRPVGLLAITSFHNLAEDDHLQDIVRGYWSPMATGSYLAVSHFTSDAVPEFADEQQEFFDREGMAMTTRGRGGIEELFKGTRLVEPGVVFTPEWRPDGGETFAGEPARSLTYAAVGVKPGESAHVSPRRERSKEYREAR